MRFAPPRLDEGRAADAYGPAAGDDRRSGEDWDTGRTPLLQGRPTFLFVVIALVAAVGLFARGGATMAPPEQQEFVIERSLEPLELAPAPGARQENAGETRRRRPDELPLVPLEWARFPNAPFEAVVDAPVVPVGSTFVTLGTLDGQLVLGQATLDRFPGAGRREERASQIWHVSSPSPLAARSDPYLAHIGASSVLVWGGVAGMDGGGPPLLDGAVYDLEADAWEPLPTPPISTGAVQTAGWMDDQLVVVSAAPQSSPETGAVALSWRPGTTAWRPLAPPPISIMATLDSVVAGDHLLIYGVESGRGVYRTELFTLGYDADDDEWRSYEHVPLQQLNEVAVVPIADGDVFMWGRPSTNDRNPEPDGLILSVETGAWSQIPHPKMKAEGGDLTAMARPVRLSAASTGQSVVIAAEPDTYMLIYNFTRERWVALAPPQATSGGRLSFADDRLVRWGGEVNGRPVPQLWVYPAIMNR